MLHVVLVILQMTFLAKSQVAWERKRKEPSVASASRRSRRSRRRRERSRRRRRGGGEEEEEAGEKEQFLSHRSSLQSDCVLSSLFLSFFSPTSSQWTHGCRSILQPFSPLTMWVRSSLLCTFTWWVSIQLTSQTGGTSSSRSSDFTRFSRLLCHWWDESRYFR